MHPAAPFPTVVFSFSFWQESFNGAKTWVRELKRRGEQDVVIALAGNKCDLADKRKVDVDEAREYAATAGVVYMDVSAKTAYNVREMFVEIAKRLPRHKAADADLLVDMGPAEPHKKKCC
jgi:GTPase SAR1 family protein